MTLPGQVHIEDGANKCPTCGQHWPRKLWRRACRVCCRPISSNHKYRTVPVGPLVFAYEHRDCQNPESYADEEIDEKEAEIPASGGAGGDDGAHKSPDR